MRQENHAKLDEQRMHDEQSAARVRTQTEQVTKQIVAIHTEQKRVQESSKKIGGNIDTFA